MLPSRIVAALGPTNTGKTHRAIERMLEHRTGMIGLPLRLLAREVYDRVKRQVGSDAVALITGEERRVGSRPRYYVCTVEAMPVGRDVDFVGVDEAQLATHWERGHVFTDRILHARGRRETWFMGAETLRPVLAKLVPTVEFRRFPRLSKLSGAGTFSLSSLPPRSAIVTFSARRVYQLAERLRNKRGGSAIVLGALSPRARNAQVGMYEAGEVDYLVATDAIGMGLNLDVDRVAFADVAKYDGRQRRSLEAAELAQIAGRAGRHRRDGSFGTLRPLPALSDSLNFAIERHSFAPLARIHWRNSDLDYSSVEALKRSLAQPSPNQILQLIDRAEDFTMLGKLMGRREVRRRAQGETAVGLLWEVCQIPDYQQMLLDHHEGTLSDIYMELTSERQRLDNAWLSPRIEPLDNTLGDIDTLMSRIASIRTWTYVSHRMDWLQSAEQWQNRTRDIEDRLSDSLHDKLVEQFVDRKKGVWTLRSSASCDDSRSPSFVRDLMRLQKRFAPLASASANAADTWAAELLLANDSEFRIDGSGNLFFGQRAIGVLTRGRNLKTPRVRVTHPEVSSSSRARLTERLIAWTRARIAELVPLSIEAANSAAPLRGLVYQLEQGLGVTSRRALGELLGGLSPAHRAELREQGVVFGKRYVFCSRAFDGQQAALRCALSRLFFDRELADVKLDQRTTLVRLSGPVPARAFLAAGFAVVGRFAIRIDALELLMRQLNRSAKSGRPLSPEKISDVLPGEVPSQVANQVVRALGYRTRPNGRVVTRGRRDKGRRRPKSKHAPPNTDIGTQKVVTQSGPPKAGTFEG